MNGYGSETTRWYIGMNIVVRGVNVSSLEITFASLGDSKNLVQLVFVPSDGGGESFFVYKRAVDLPISVLNPPFFAEVRS